MCLCSALHFLSAVSYTARSCAPAAARVCPPQAHRGRCGVRCALAPLLRRGARADTRERHWARRSPLRRQARRRERRGPRAHAHAGTRFARTTCARSIAQQLSRAHQVDAQLLASQLEYDLWRLEELQDWRWDPLLYTGIAGDSVYSLLARDFAPLPDRLRKCRRAARRVAALSRAGARGARSRARAEDSC